MPLLQMGVQRFLLVGLCVVVCICRCAPNVVGQVTDAQEVTALLAVRSKLNDPHKYLNWARKSDPCASKWTGVLCNLSSTDGYFHVLELRLLRMNLSGTLAPELGQLTHMKHLNFMWNDIKGSIPKEIGNITALVHLLLSGNRLSGYLPVELGFLPNLNRLQLDLNMLSGPIPTTLANLTSVEHFHMNDNQFSGQIPPEIANIASLEHILLDNNHLSGHLPPELALMPGLTILQLDNNNFAGTKIPDSYATFPKLVKLSLRNCSLQGTLPDFSSLSSLHYLDLSNNHLTGNIMTNRLSENITTIILSDNQLSGSIPSNFSGLPQLQKLALNNNLLNGSVSSDIWENVSLTSESKLDINLENNLISGILWTVAVSPNVTVKLGGNPVCGGGNQQSIASLCGASNGDVDVPNENLEKPVMSCPSQSCPREGNYEYIPTAPDQCICAAPFGVEIRLRSPSIYQFLPYLDQFRQNITESISLYEYQLYVESISWEAGPRLRMVLLFFPDINISTRFNASEVQRIAAEFARFEIDMNDVFGPYDLLNFILLPSIHNGGGGGLSKGALAGIVVGSIFFAGVILASVMLFLQRRRQQSRAKPPVKDQSCELVTYDRARVPMKVEGLKAFGFEDLEKATNNFRTQIGQGGYGKVYKGTTADGAVVAIKRAQQGSLQGDKEFYTEIEMLSRLHHRNLVSLIGYCDEKDEQMLVYEFMPNGSLHDLLNEKYTEPLNLQRRLHIALGASRGILYLHTEADPPIIHRDIKANNILLDSKWTAKVSDFGISRLAPVSSASGDTATHISTNVKGTPGYLDPDYFQTYKLTNKSDVYSLGIVFLELVTGMQPIAHGRNIVSEVKTACESGMMFSIIDKTMGPYHEETVKKFMALALKCSMEKTKDRPSMLEVVRELENVSSSMHLDVTPNDTSTSTPASPTTPSLYDNYATKNLLPGTGGDPVNGVIPANKAHWSA